MNEGQIIAKLREWFGAEVDKVKLGDKVAYDLSIAVGPVDGAVQPALMIVMWLPSALLGQTLHTVVVIPNPEVITAEHMEGIVPGMLENLRKARTDSASLTEPSPRPGRS